MIENYVLIDIYMIITFFISYLICSVNPAIIICKKRTGEDIRKLGSGNAGSANAMRVLGKLTGILVIILDVAKVFLSYGLVILMCKIFSQNIEGKIISTFILSAILGHCFPIYYGLKGGKGGIISIALGFILNYQYTLVCVIVCLVVYIITKIPSAATLAGVAIYLILTIVMNFRYVIPVAIISVIVLFQHRNNIKRMFQKQEKVFKM